MLLFKDERREAMVKYRERRVSETEKMRRDIKQRKVEATNE